MALTAKDIRGVSVMAPTPCVPGGEHWSNTDSVDVEETARMTENLIRDGVGSIAACGTTGECHSLLWEEKVKFIDTMVQVNKGRVPIFAGATALGTKETIRQMKALQDIGAQGAFVGLPLWQTPTLENSVRWFADLSEAVPDMGIMVYSNAMFFKSTFPAPFWYAVADKAPTVITNKIASPAINVSLMDIIARTGDRITYLPNEGQAYAAWKQCPDHINGHWSTSASMGPEPSVALADALQANDEELIATIIADLRSVPLFIPDFNEFPKYNVQAEKSRFNAAGYINCGPSRAPYLYEDLPDDWKKSTKANGEGWAQMRKKYVKAKA